MKDCNVQCCPNDYDDDSFVDRLKAGAKSKVIVAKVQITRRCNLRCSKCPIWRSPRKPDMPRDKICEIIDKLAKHGCSIVSFSRW